jgi:hypothetical protein
VIILIAFSACEQKSYDKGFHHSTQLEQNVSLQKVGEFTIESTDMIGGLKSFFTVSADTTFLFFDEKKKQFLYVNSSGKVIQALGSEGRGPSEFTRVSHFTLDERKNLIAYDNAQAKVKIINSENDLLSSFSLDMPGGRIPVGHSIYAREQKIYIAMMDPQFIEQSWKCRLMAVYNYNGDFIRMIGRYDPFLKTSKVLANRPFFDINFATQQVVAVNQSSYRLQVFELSSGKRTQYFGQRSTYFKISQQEITPSMSIRKKQELGTNMSYSNGAFMTEEYYLHFFMNLTDRWFKTLNISNRKYYLSIYDKKSENLIETITLPHSLGSVAHNRLYLVERSNPNNYTIGAYELR